ncbi:hypothetical protein CFELI_04635 [Corynebacterium felinum]|uniref:Uncharacterized protein n=1 Tax=Corynebacterium felinum TaxID=131318 RepID=A0ABU2B980_9CORY|nr:hypothetical protein [Corynebacterium felinum]WJY94556.1 hypothetical protein CFELI_04635 [Corynebacterium felinum]
MLSLNFSVLMGFFFLVVMSANAFVPTLCRGLGNGDCGTDGRFGVPVVLGGNVWAFALVHVCCGLGWISGKGSGGGFCGKYQLEIEQVIPIKPQGNFCYLC